MLEIDSTFCKVHQDATGAIKNLGNQAIGVSRGCKTTKSHALVNEHFQLIKVILTGGEVAIDLLEAVDIKDKTVLADRTFVSEKIRRYIEENNGIACIPNKSNSVVKHDFNDEVYKSRNIIESFFNVSKNFGISQRAMINWRSVS